MAAFDSHFGTPDPIALGAITALAGVHIASLQDKLEMAIKTHIPILQDLAAWWPVLLIAAGIVLLLTRKSPQDARSNGLSRFSDNQEGIQ